MVDAMITLFPPEETEFTSGGLGNLSEATRCEVMEERNGEFELTLEYPITGRHYSEITYRSIIFVKPNPFDKPQPFRVYAMSKPIRGIVTYNARHLRYDLSGYPVAPFTAKELSGVFSQLSAQMSKPWNSKKHPFTFTMDRKDSQGSEFSLLTPCAMLSLLGGTEGSVLDRYHGEYEWDKWNCILHENRGEDRGVTVAYGKNMTDFTQDENCENVWTGVYPYWYSDEDGLVELGTDDKIVYCEGTYNHELIYILDLTSEFEEKPTSDQLRTKAQQYIKDNDIGKPTVSLTVSFLPLSDTVNYADVAFLETVKLCDTVHVIFPEMGVTSESQCITTTYNCLTGKYISIELGDPKKDISSTISEQGTAIAERPTTMYVQQSIANQTKLITGNNGGYFVIHDSNGDGKPDEALFMDTMDIATAKKVLRINQMGIGFSSTGYNGPYKTAWTLDGVFNADFITAGTMAADRILGGVLRVGGSAYGDGSIRLYNASNVEIGYMDKTGIHFGNGVFDLGADGNANFGGNVYAKNIQVGTSGGVDRGYVSGSQIGSGAVGSGNLANNSVTNNKLGGSSVTGDKIMDGNVTSGKIADGNVTNAKIANSAVGNNKIAGSAVSEAKCDATIQGYFADIISANKIFAGQTTASYMHATTGVFKNLTVTSGGFRYKNSSAASWTTIKTKDINGNDLTIPVLRC